MRRAQLLARPGPRALPGLLALLALAALSACGGRASNDPALSSQAPLRSSARIRRSGARTSTSGQERAAAASPDPQATVEARPEPVARAGTGAGWWSAYAARSPIDTFEGRVSYYSDALAGRSTASGAPYDPSARTAASRTLPFGTVLRVTRTDTGAQVIVRVNDRGPFGDRQRVLDLSRAAAEELDMIRRGVIEVRVEVLERP